MTYIDSSFYTNTFKGQEIPGDEFDRLAEAASEAIYAACRMKPDENMVTTEDFKKAVCYEVELLYEQGGLDAITGLSVAAGGSDSESLGDYSVTASKSRRGVATLAGGISVSPVALQILKRLGLMSRWAYSGFFEPWR